ncbi:MAG: roadblock/LC7 domain-containing protein [Candidatus Odinarchaeia archaeon]
MAYNPSELLKAYLQNIKNINGVENVVLTQRDGFPINSAGVWLSQKEIFNVSSAASAIYAVAEDITHQELKNILVEGSNAKIFLTPLPKTKEYFITLTTKNRANLGAIYVEAKNSVELLQKILIDSGLDLKPPLRDYGEAEIKEILENFSLKEQEEQALSIDNFNFTINDSTILEINSFIKTIIKSVPEIDSVLIALNGGHLLSSFSKDDTEIDKSLAVMVYTLYDTANRVFWVLKKSFIERILCESDRYLLFVYGLKDAVLSINVRKKTGIRIGLLRILFSSYVKGFNNIFNKIKRTPTELPIFDFGSSIQSMVIK